jgi:acyl-CoA synthetase (AMP-forming)/AMP-acid ligase II
VTDLHPPAVHFRGRTWSRDELGALAARWRRDLGQSLGSTSLPVALVMDNDPESIALFFALICLPSPVVLLGPDPRAWRSSPPLPHGTPVVLSGAARELGGAVVALGCRPLTVNIPRHPGPEPSPAVVTSPGLVGFTGGTTGPPKPVYRSMASALRHSAVVADVFGLRPGDSIVGALPLSSFHGIGDALLLASILGGPLGLLPRFDHRAALRLFATERYRYFPATPMMIDVLARCPVSGSTHPAPSLVKVGGGRQTASAFGAFLDRFRTPPRPAYGASETGIITTDAAPPDRVRPEAVGRAVPDVRLAIGDIPEASLPPGVPGRVWVSTSRYMEGYGFPPALEPRDERGEWRPTQDRGMVDADGYLTLLGRLDDAFKTPSGQLVDPSEVADVLQRLPGIQGVAVVPLPARTGAIVGALVAAESRVDPGMIRQHAARLLPRWARPQAVLVVKELPRLANGKVDRQACTTLLGGEVDAFDGSTDRAAG